MFIYVNIHYLRITNKQSFIMPKTKVVGVRVPMEDYYSFLAEASLSQIPIGTWAHQVLKHEVMQIRKMNNGGKIDIPTVQTPGTQLPKIPTKNTLYRIYITDARGRYETEYKMDDNGNIYNEQGIIIDNNFSQATKRTMDNKPNLMRDHRGLHYYKGGGWYSCHK